MRCRDVMNVPAVTCREADPVDRCAQLMKEWNLGFLPVVDEGGQLAGVVTDRDLSLRVLAEGLPSTVPVGQVATRDVVSCRAEDELWMAEETLARSKKSRLVVIDESGRILGVLSLSDLGQVEDFARFSQLYQAVTGRETARPRANLRAGLRASSLI